MKRGSCDVEDMPQSERDIEAGLLRGAAQAPTEVCVVLCDAVLR